MRFRSPSTCCFHRPQGVMLLLWVLMLTSASSRLPAKEPPRFQLALENDVQGRDPGGLVLTFRESESERSNESIRDVLVWWTTPDGRQTSIVMKQVSEKVWASRLSLAGAKGKNRVAVVVLGKSAEETLGRTAELIYDCELPQKSLTLVRQKESGLDNLPAQPAAASHSVVRHEGGSWTLPVVVILVGVFNLALLLAGLISFKVIRRVSGFSPVTGSSATLTRIFVAGGMVDRANGGALPWDAEVSVMTENMEEETPSAEETPVKKPAIMEKLKILPTMELMDKVHHAIANLERDKVTGDLKDLIKTAGEELGLYDQEKDVPQEKSKPAEPATGRNEALELDLSDMSF